jgi:hypothetical protein
MELTDERRKEIVEIWKTVVSVQQHFNDIEMRIRSVFITILLALFASIGFFLDKGIGFQFWVIKIQFSTIIPLFGVLGASLFYFIDRYWYHRLLYGAVIHGISIETTYETEIPELALSAAIGKQSPYAPDRFTGLFARLLVREDRFLKTGRIHSDGKIELFYKSVMLILFLISVLLSLCGGIQIAQVPMLPPAS